MHSIQQQQQQQLQAEGSALAGVAEVVAVQQLLAAAAAGLAAAPLALQQLLAAAWLQTSGALCVLCWGCAWCGCHLSSGAKAWLRSCWMLRGELTAAAHGLLLLSCCCWLHETTGQHQCGCLVTESADLATILALTACCTCWLLLPSCLMVHNSLRHH
jgi:hypothetical protein